MESTLINYFNTVLKDNLDYRETYESPIYTSDGNIFFNVSGPDDLKNLLIGNPEITKQLKEALLSALKTYYSDLTSINLRFSPGTFEIILGRNPLGMIEVDPYVNIASRFDTVDQLNDFCRSSKDTLNICKTKEFWRSLIRVVYPQRYKGEYNYEQVYKGYLNIKNSPSEDVIGLSDVNNSVDVSSYARFLFDEGLVPSQYYRKFILLAIYFGATLIFNQIVDYINDIQNVNDLILTGFYDAVKNGNVEYISNLLGIISNNDKIVTAKDLILKLHDHVDSFLWNPSAVDILQEYAKNIADIDIEYANYVVSIAIENAILFKDEYAMKYILNRYKLSRNDITSWLTDIQYGRIITDDNIKKILQDYLR